MRGRTLLLLGAGAIALLILVNLARSGGSGETLSYRGERYEHNALVTAAEVERANLVASGETVRGMQAFVERRTPSRVLFLLRPDGRYDAFLLVEEP